MNKKARDAYLEPLFVKLHDQLRAMALVYVNELAAEDTIQETFLIACKNFDSLRESPNPEGWIVIVFKNVAMKMRRTQFRWLSRTVHGVEEYENGESAGTDDHIYTDEDDYPFETEDVCIRAVGKEPYTLFKELYLMRLPIEEVAHKHNLSIDACRNRAHRTKQKLRKFFENFL